MNNQLTLIEGTCQNHLTNCDLNHYLQREDLCSDVTYISTVINFLYLHLSALDIILNVQISTLQMFHPSQDQLDMPPAAESDCTLTVGQRQQAGERRCVFHLQAKSMKRRGIEITNFNLSIVLAWRCCCEHNAANKMKPLYILNLSFQQTCHTPTDPPNLVCIK